MSEGLEARTSIAAAVPTIGLSDVLDTPILLTVEPDESNFVNRAQFTQSLNPITSHPIYHFLVQVMSARVTQIMGAALLIAGLALIQSSTVGLGIAATGGGILAGGFFSKYVPRTKPFDVSKIELDNNFQRTPLA